MVATEHVANLGGLVEQLIGRDQREIRIHDFHNRSEAIERSADTETGETVFANRRCNQPIRKFFSNAFGGAGRATA